MMKKLTALSLALCLMLVLASAAPAEEAPEKTLMGGWEATADSTVTDHEKELLNKAFDGLNSAIEPLALLGTQVVAGTNYCILARVTPAFENPKPYYVLIYIYEDLQGGVQLLQIRDFDIAALYEQEPADSEAAQDPNG